MTFSKIKCGFLGLLIPVLFWAACTKMDDTYKGFIHGSIVYVGSADSVRAYSGKNRIMLSWLSSDATATKAKIYWNNRSDSLLVPLEIKAPTDTIQVIITDLTEGSYSFEVYLFDEEGNSSVQSTAVGEAYGKNYVKSLLQRPVKSALFNDGKVEILWGTADKAVVGTQVRYVDSDNQPHSIDVPVDSLSTVLEGFDYSARDTFSYRTLYVPDSMSIDSFYATYATAQVTGPPVEYNRAAWTAVAQDYDVPSGRVPQNVLDGKTSSVWHMDKSHSYPHHIDIDMHAVNVVNGFTFIQRTPLNGAAQLIEISVSSDNENWESLGSFTLGNTGDKQFLELLEPVSFRYFTVTFKSDYKGGDFTAIAEMNTYKR